MKKRIVSLFLAAVLSISAMTGAAMAADAQVWPGQAEALLTEASQIAGEVPGQEKASGKESLPGSKTSPEQGAALGSEILPGSWVSPEQGAALGSEILPGSGVSPEQGAALGQEILPGSWVSPEQGELPGLETLPGQGALPGQEGLPGQGELPEQETPPGSDVVPGQDAVPGSEEAGNLQERFEVLTEIEHGQVVFTSQNTSWCETEEVTFMIIPEQGYFTEGVTVTGSEKMIEVQSCGEALYRFRMPGENVSLKVAVSPQQKETENPQDEQNSSVEDPADFKAAVFDEENAFLMEPETQEDAKLLEAIEDGEVIALAPLENMMLEPSVSLMSTADEGTVSRAAGTGRFTLRIGAYMKMDEVWVNDGTASDHVGTAYREIVYEDDDGVFHISPLYCMNPSKNGPLGDPIAIRDEAVKILSDSNLKKILYYGYGGPGDISGSYDPTCSHCDWSNAQNRYVLTHMALSKVYSGDVSRATEAECEHVGLNRWISKLTSLAVPNVKDLKFYGKDSNGDTVSAKDMTANLTYYRVVPDSLSWCGMKSGVQISGVYRLTSTLDQNGITFTRGTDDGWVMGFWKDEEDYKTRGLKDPRILGKGKSVTLYKGARIRYAFPRTVTGNQKLSFSSVLKPVEYIAISCTIQMNQSNMQDLGTYYYEGKREQLSLTFRPAPSGTVILRKSADQDPNQKIQGAGYRLMAAENIVSNGTTVLKKDEKMDGGYTDKNGEVTFSYVPVGKYYLIEVGIKEGTEAEKYLVDVAKHPVTVAKNTSKVVAVSEIPDMRGRVSIQKLIEGTSLNLEGAEFTLYSWSKSGGKYTNGVKLSYDASVKRYVSELLTYSAENQGKFLVEETKNPNGFTGVFRKEFCLTKPGQEELFEYTAENIPSPRQVEITKIDSVTREILKDAQFTIFEWDKENGAYKSQGEVLTFQEDTGRYRSSVLEITDRNIGRFKVTETRIPEGYTGMFEAEIDLNEENAQLQFTAENTPVPPKTGRITVRKTDSVTGEILEDAEFTVYAYQVDSGTYEDTLGTNAKLSFDEKTKLYVSKDLVIDSSNNGKFKVVETKIPKGYQGGWEKEFVLTEENPDPATFEAANDPDRPPLTQLTVIKKIKESDILWAHGNPVFFFTVEGTDEKGISRKYENYVSFSPGAYTLDGSGYASMQITFRNVPAGQYQVYENPVLYYYLENSIANTANVSIVKGKAPAYGLAPREIAYGNVRLTASENNASITFINKKSRYDHYIHNDVVKNRVPLASS